ncbi:uncharacterized protein LOC129599291 [Paramacrobiotus metropolitanus]|uniref:uncharacterized protein LOC129599291 n=1 Tax=Paramacrobiotus metropolitanus TaxID=2943436 RepID=UPI002445D294|nr:uncharacterized protein LOC129599291 [Paramacrobiotus metropolitanus]
MPPKKKPNSNLSPKKKRSGGGTRGGRAPRTNTRPSRKRNRSPSPAPTIRSQVVVVDPPPLDLQTLIARQHQQHQQQIQQLLDIATPLATRELGVPRPISPATASVIQIESHPDGKRDVHQRGESIKRSHRRRRDGAFSEASRPGLAAADTMSGYLWEPAGDIRPNTTLQRLLGAHISSSSRTTYDCSLNRFRTFCLENRLTPLPAAPATVAAFVAHLFEDKAAFRTCKVYLAAIHNYHREAGLPNPAADDLVIRAVNGYKRLNGPTPDRRLPITMDVMRSLKTRLAEYKNTEEALMLWSAFCMAFFGFMRVSEIVSKSRNSFDAASTLTFDDVELTSECVIITLKRTKTDQCAAGTKIELTATNRSVCPVRAIGMYHRQRRLQGESTKPFYRHSDGRYLTRETVDRSMKSLLEGHPDRLRFSTHSFRIGAATEAAAQAVPKDEIKRAGRWKSDCVDRYIRPDVLTNPNFYRRRVCLGAKGPGTGGRCRQ